MYPPFSNGVGRWGDYSALTIDPADDCTFWYVNALAAVGRRTEARSLFERLLASRTVHVTVQVDAPGTIPRSEGKAVRVIDNR